MESSSENKMRQSGRDTQRRSKDLVHINLGSSQALSLMWPLWKLSNIG